MKSAILLPINNYNKNVIPTIVSLLKPDKPVDLIIITNDSLDDTLKGVVSAFLKSCCDGGVYTEEQSSEYKLNKKELNGQVVANLIVNNKNESEMKNFAFNLFKEYEVFITATCNSIYADDYIDKYLAALKDAPVGAAYSDYVENGVPVALTSLHALLQSSIAIKDIAFKRRLFKSSPFQMDNYSVIKAAYQNSVIRHIPTQLFVT